MPAGDELWVPSLCLGADQDVVCTWICSCCLRGSVRRLKARNPKDNSAVGWWQQSAADLGKVLAHRKGQMRLGGWKYEGRLRKGRSRFDISR